MSTAPLSPRFINVAIDLDGVLTEHPRPLAVAANEHFGMDLPESAFIDSAGLNVPLSVRDWVYGEDGPAAHLMPAAEAQEFIARMIEILGLDHVRILTARPEGAQNMTRTWLKRHGFPETKILFSDDKAAVAAGEGCTFAVEDSLRHATNYSRSGITSFLIETESTPAYEPHERIWPVQSLMSIVYRLDELQRAIQAEAALRAIGLPKIVIADQIDAAARARLAEAAELIDVDGTNLPALLAVLPDADALVVRSETQVTEQVLAAGPKLRVVARAGVGVDNVDLDAATRRGVLVLNAPGANRISAGEHTIALLLAVTRQINYADSTTRSGEWARKKIKPIDLAGKTVGIVGLGRVGSVVATRLKAFEMTLLGYDPFIRPERFAELDVEPVDYLEMLGRVDIITYHVPSTDQTRHMLDAERIALLKPGAIVINAARGDVVDQDALAEAVAKGHLRGAGVDVFPFEPTTESPLFGLQHVVLTPHTGGSSAEALANVGEMISTTTLAALAGQAVPNAVNLPPASLLAPDLQRLTSVAAAAGHLLSVVQPEVPSTFRTTVRGTVPGDVIEHVANHAIAEAIRQWTGRPTTPVNAALVAAELGIQVSVLAGASDPDLEPSFSFEVLGETSHHVRIMWDRKNAGIVEVDRFALDRALSGDVLITHHTDVPGIVGRVGTILGLYSVNIAGMSVGRHHRGGEALMVLNVDDAIPDGVLEEVKTIPGVKDAYRVSLPPAQPRVATALATADMAK